MSRIERTIGSLFFQLPSNQLSIEQLIVNLQRNQAFVANRIRIAPPNQKNHGWATHIIGIEIWCQHKAQSLLDEAVYMGEYDSFRPHAEVPYQSLAQLFEQTRAESLSLATTLKDVPLNKTVPHNQWGQLNSKGWLNYMGKHAGISSLAIR